VRDKLRQNRLSVLSQAFLTTTPPCSPQFANIAMGLAVPVSYIALEIYTNTSMVRTIIRASFRAMRPSNLVLTLPLFHVARQTDPPSQITRLHFELISLVCVCRAISPDSMVRDCQWWC
jgi:hypothetical protein